MRFDLWTLALQAINFLVLVWILHRFLYRPVLAMIDRRRGAIQAAYTEAAARDDEATAALADYEAKLAAIDRERHRVLDEAHRRAEAERATTLAETTADRERLRAEAQREIEGMHAAADEALTQWAAETAVALARRLLEDSAGGIDAEPLLLRAWDRLAALPAERQAELRQALAESGALEIATAPPLGESARARALERLRAWAEDDAVEAAFAVDDALIVGAELRFPHAAVGASWRDALEDARAAMLRNEHAEEHADEHAE